MSLAIALQCLPSEIKRVGNDFILICQYNDFDLGRLRAPSVSAQVSFPKAPYDAVFDNKLAGGTRCFARDPLAKIQEGFKFEES